MEVEKPTFCRICEPMCGLIATVRDGHLTGVRGDRDNPYSQGFACSKSSAMVEITHDPDRLLTPMRRRGAPGSFEPVTWDEALGDISARLQHIVAEHGPHAYASFFGNPPVFHHGSLLALQGFQAAIGSPWKYGVNGEDGASHMVANALLYGSTAIGTVPDLWRTHFALIIGANPFVSRGSTVSEPQLRQALRGIVERGGRVVVVDPRRTETARNFEHLAIRPGTDAWLLAAMLNTMIAEGLVDRAAITEHTAGFEVLASHIEGFSADLAAEHCGIAANVIRDLARDFAEAPSGVVYGRTGTCTQLFGTLNNFLQQTINVVTGNLEREGGANFGWGPIDFAKFASSAGLSSFGTNRSRTTGLPDVAGMLPSQALVPDIKVPGPGQIRALLTFGANPVLSSGRGGTELEGALETLDLHFSCDLYVNETNRFAHYILPVPTFYERDDAPFALMGNMLRPSLFATEAVQVRIGDTRTEFEILNEIARRMGRGGAYAAAPLRWLARVGINVSPRTMVDALIRTSPVGDWFGLRRTGLSWKKLLTKHPHGTVIKGCLPVGRVAAHIRHDDQKIHLATTEVLDELHRLHHVEDRSDLPMRAIGMRELRSQNTWMHNAERLMPSDRRHVGHIHPDDASRIGIGEGDLACIVSDGGEISIPIHLSEDLQPGTVAIPHGWGHNGGWQRANAAGGVNSNQLTAKDPNRTEPLSGMSVLNGIPVRVERVRESMQLRRDVVDGPGPQVDTRGD
ncbi:molybdopterin-containing oxidoreductase family protein [Mycolicibacterium porcinum]|uniref:Molybdopterin-dependent oxidoreductase n=1 Tax=Mycolicibacterium porcinum TaxID=39693 RepID=A0AAW5SV38_9MYCO|nr:molybdopterin-dependent oxidoreductase [Mycolicibacterium porcinum]MCV7386455.1 molybdopterin-dependent oxidoreductase [Mycolicibacterium porcinum]ORB39046.1 hypothetical protein BST41_18715 [Mycolicibacterium porcinum]CDO30874.1 molybdopterin oxidoreductase [Mycolicibacterium vulneris]